MSALLSRRAFCRSGLMGLSVLTPLGAAAAGATDLHGRQLAVMGTRATILIHHARAPAARAGLDAAIRDLFAVHEAMTLFEPSPLVSINRRAGQGLVDLDPLTWHLLDLSLRLHKNSGGLLDPSLAGRTQAPALPALSRDLLGFAHLGFDRQRAQLHMENGTRLDLNAVAKGHAVDRATRTLRGRGLTHFIVNVGGDLYVSGHANGEHGGWPVRVHDSKGRVRDLGHLSDRAIATSGLRARGPQRSWLIDPVSGHEVRPAASVTVIDESAAQADGWATALTVTSPQRQVQLARQQGLLALISRDSGLSPLAPLAATWRGSV